MFVKSVLAVAGASLAAAQMNATSLCDKYTTAVFKTNNATNQYKLMVYVVNTAVIGNFTPASAGGSMVPVTGILNNGTYNGTMVNLLPYFDGGLYSTNVDGAPGVMNFLDGGGAAPLMQYMPAMDTTSNQYFLLTHLYEFFGLLLKCSMYSSNGFPSYGGDNSQYSVHKYMDLDAYQMGYFISQVGAAAESFGVSAADATAIGDSLNAAFNYRCLPAVALTSPDPELQSMCTDPSCPIADNQTCSAYGAVIEPVIANASLAEGQGISSTVTLLASGATSATGAAATSSPVGVVVSGSSAMVGTATVGSATMGSASASATLQPVPSSFAYATAAPVFGAVMAAGAAVLAF